MRLDKFLCEMKIGTRSQVKTYIRQGLVNVNGMAVLNADTKIEELTDQVSFKGKILQYQKYVYYMLNKPEGVVSATRDDTAPTVVSLLGSAYREDIFPVGRLDRDTTGLLLLTNDGELAHRLLSPKRHVDKVYHVVLEKELTEDNICALEQGVDIGEEAPALPARVTVTEENTILLTLHEGRFHQVKRMMQAVGNHAQALKRVAFGGLLLDENLKPGQFRELTEEEVGILRKKVE